MTEIPKASFEDRIEYWRYTQARSAFFNARQTCEWMLANNVFGSDAAPVPPAGCLGQITASFGRSEAERQLLCRALTASVLMLYGRPFKKATKPVFPLSRDFVPEKMKSHHDTLIAHRDKMYAHADRDYVDEDGKPLNAIEIAYDGSSRVKADVIIYTFKRESLRDTIAVSDALYGLTGGHRAAAWERLFKATGGVPEGDFRFNIDPDDDRILLPRSD